MESFTSNAGNEALIFGRSLEQTEIDSSTSPEPQQQSSIAVALPSIGNNKQDYISFPNETTVSRVLEEYDEDPSRLVYLVRFRDGREEEIRFEQLLNYTNGQAALNSFQNESQEDSEENIFGGQQESTSSEETSGVELPSRRGRPRIYTVDDSGSEDELSLAPARVPSRRKLKQGRNFQMSNGTRTQPSRRMRARNSMVEEDDEISSSDSNNRRRSSRVQDARASRRKSRQAMEEESDDLVHLVDEDDEDEDESTDDMMRSDVVTRTRTRKRGRPVTKTKPVKARKITEATRQSVRSTRHVDNMRDPEMGDIYRSNSDAPRALPKAQGAREAFQPLPNTDEFHLRHCQQCDTCGRHGAGGEGQLIHCQGCSLSFHKACLGARGSREHLVTKIGEANFILQCRRCIGHKKEKDRTMPDLAVCQSCREVGRACRPFRRRKTALQEEREREENDGEDPISVVDPTKINNVANVLFRCAACTRPFHFHHLKSRGDFMTMDEDEESIAKTMYHEHRGDWLCLDCAEHTIKVTGLVAWRPTNLDYHANIDLESLSEDAKEYLVRWEKRSHAHCIWMPGAWIYGVVSPTMRKAFAQRVNGPTMRTEDAIPEEWLRVDIVLDVRYTSKVDTREEEVDKARIREVKQALIKFKGQSYEDAVWDEVPKPDDGDRWTDFVKAYDEWVMGKYIKVPRTGVTKQRLEKSHNIDFNTLEKKKQPDKLTGGELMKYQLEGLNWLYYRWWLKFNAILADEMGLGKTIQVIGFLATLVQDHGCFPFLIVVPNGTVPNWRREIKQWAPSIRVVTYYGSSIARNMAYQHELFPSNAKELRCHVVVTSYEAASEDSCQRFFKRINWQGLIVDEGQRLKSDKTILYDCLSALKVPFRMLLTGTPLQNNARELFNLLQFLDDSFDAAALETEYAELTRENVPQLHELIRPFFLRRTKAQVLTFLPPMAQIVLPVSMSSLQAKLYKSILSRNTQLIKALYDSTSVAKNDRTSLNNILMQLRKCLCHPFVFSQDIEERTDIAEVSHRNLVEASAKLQLLEVLLPKLHQRGHRVLIFSQFLHMLDIVEDFMGGLMLDFTRLDGNVGAMEKQKRIDAFNAPNSPLFAFLLSTRAGGVGINLATADTVIILDPDFNPHVDIQALSRAHRIGQKNKVLCFQLMTRASAEEKMVQIGRKKLALDHVLIEQMDQDEEAGIDVESILKYGAADILEGRTQDIRYDDASIDKLIDRSQIENTKADEDDSAESRFSYARMWANDAGVLEDTLEADAEEEKAPDPGIWDQILKEREQIAAREAAARQEILGRGRRVRQTVDYGLEENDNTPRRNRKKDAEAESSDTDFKADEDKKDDETADEGPDGELDADEVKEVQQSSQPPPQRPAAVQGLAQPPAPRPSRPQYSAQTGSFRRAAIRWPGPGQPDPLFADNEGPIDPDEREEMERDHPITQCVVCSTPHRQGYCPLKLAGPEFCNLCGLSHFGVQRSCPHIRSETQVREMLVALRHSPESRELVDIAKKYLTGVKGALVQEKKRKQERSAFRNALAAQQGGIPGTAKFSSGMQVLTGPPGQSSSQPRPQGFQQPGQAPPRPGSSSQHQHKRPLQPQIPGPNGISSQRLTSNGAHPGAMPIPPRPQACAEAAIGLGSTHSLWLSIE